jgi:neopullulanase
MKQRLLIILLLAAITYMTAPLCNVLASRNRLSPPIVEKIDPPGWWIGHTINPLQIIIRGRNLNQTSLRSNTAGVSVASSKVNAAGDNLIAYLDIDPKRTAAGNVVLTVEGAQGSTKIDFGLQELPDAAGKYQGFGPDDVIYLLMIDRFSDGDPANNDPARSAGFYDRRAPRAYHGGDLQGIIDRLQYLKDFGVTAIWITPIYDNSDRVSDYHGYGAVDLYSVEEHFGDVAKFRTLVERAHALGIKVIQDQVPNHIGPSHPWTDSPPTPNFLNGSRQQHINNVFDIPALTRPNSDTVRVEATLRGWFADILPDINQDDPEATQYLIQNTLWWIHQTGMDGIRADTFPYVPRAFWAKWTAAIKKQFPQFTVVGEVLNGNPAIVSFFQGGVARFDGIDTGLDTVFDFPTNYRIRDFFLHGQKSLSEIIEADSRYPRPSILVPFFGNHDIERFSEDPFATPEKLILSYTYLLTMRGTPQIYYGDEIGMEGKEDPDNRRDFPGGFPGDTRSAFTAEGRTKKEQKIFSAVQKLLAVRRAQPALRGGEMQFLRDSDGLVAYLRSRDAERVIVAINNKDEKANWTLDLPAGLFDENARFSDLLGRVKSVKVKRGKINIKLNARSAAIYRPN